MKKYQHGCTPYNLGIVAGCQIWGIKIKSNSSHLVKQPSFAAAVTFSAKTDPKHIIFLGKSDLYGFIALAPAASERVSERYSSSYQKSRSLGFSLFWNLGRKIWNKLVPYFGAATPGQTTSWLRTVWRGRLAVPRWNVNLETCCTHNVQQKLIKYLHRSDLN